jgi:hypothetical protein
MNEPILLFETDDRLGMPKLRASNPAAGDWSAKELALLEELLRPRYDRLVREGDGTIDFKGRRLYVTKKAGDTTRQPTLELRDEQAPAPRVDGVFVHADAVQSQTNWGQGFLIEIDRLLAGGEVQAILPEERVMLELVRVELKRLFENASTAETGLLVLTAILLMAEQLSISHRPGEPHPYTFALSGIRRLVSQKTTAPRTPWGPLPDAPNTTPAPSWLGWAWRRLKRT